MRWPWQRGRRQAPQAPPVTGDLPSRPYDVFAALDRHGVEYVVIGGVAVQAHGNPRTTLDVDFVAAPELANIERLAAALEDLQARLLGVDAEHVPSAAARRGSPSGLQDGSRDRRLGLEWCGQRPPPRRLGQRRPIGSSGRDKLAGESGKNKLKQ